MYFLVLLLTWLWFQSNTATVNITFDINTAINIKCIYIGLHLQEFENIKT